MIAHWPFDERSGTIARDVIGNRNAIMQGDAVGWSLDGARGGAATVSRGWGRVDWDLPAALPDAFTVALWYEPSPESRDYDRYFTSYFWTGEDRGAINMDSVLKLGVRCIVQIGTSWHSPGADAVFSPSGWRHVACSYDGSMVRVYANGVIVASDGAQGSLVASEPFPVSIGASLQDGGDTQNEASAKFDDVRIYNRALTGDEMLALATP